MPATDVTNPTPGRIASRHSGGSTRGFNPKTPSQTTRTISGHTQRGVLVTIGKNDGMTNSGGDHSRSLPSAAGTAHRRYVEVLAFFVFWRQSSVYDARIALCPVAALSSAASVPGTFEIIAVHSWLGRPIPLSMAPRHFPETAFLTVVISVVIGLFVEQRLRANADAERTRVAALPQPKPDAPGSTAPDFFRRIPPALGRNLLALEMEDHYLGLMRLRDALTELAPGRGQQVHRSW